MSLEPLGNAPLEAWDWENLLEPRGNAPLEAARGGWDNVALEPLRNAPLEAWGWDNLLEPRGNAPLAARGGWDNLSLDRPRSIKGKPSLSTETLSGVGVDEVGAWPTTLGWFGLVGVVKGSGSDRGFSAESALARRYMFWGIPYSSTAPSSVTDEWDLRGGSGAFLLGVVESIGSNDQETLDIRSKMSFI